MGPCQLGHGFQVTNAYGNLCYRAACCDRLPGTDSERFDSRDWAGMRRDLYYLIGWQVVVTAVIYKAPFAVSNWSQDEKDNLGGAQWRENVTDPV